MENKKKKRIEEGEKLIDKVMDKCFKLHGYTKKGENK